MCAGLTGRLTRMTATQIVTVFEHLTSGSAIVNELNFNKPKEIRSGARGGEGLFDLNFRLIKINLFSHKSPN